MVRSGDAVAGKRGGLVTGRPYGVIWTPNASPADNQRGQHSGYVQQRNCGDLLHGCKRHRR